MRKLYTNHYIYWKNIPMFMGFLWDIFMFLPSSKWVYKPTLPSSGIRLTDRVGWSRNNGITFIHERKIMSYTDDSGWKGMTCKQHDPTEFVEGNVNRACIFLQKFTINPSICGLLFIINPLLFIFGMQRVGRACGFRSPVSSSPMRCSNLYGSVLVSRFLLDFSIVRVIGKLSTDLHFG